MRVIRCFMAVSGGLEEAVAIQADDGLWTLVNGTHGYVFAQRETLPPVPGAELPTGVFDNPRDALMESIRQLNEDLDRMADRLLNLRDQVNAFRPEALPDGPAS